MSNCAANVASAHSGSMPEISVDGVFLDKSLYAEELQYHYARDIESAWQKAGQALVVRQLLINELRRDCAGDETISDEECEVQALVEKNVSYKEPSDDECRRYFENNRDCFMSQPLLEVEHILVAAPGSEVGEREEARMKAQSIIEKIIAEPALFPELAEQFSDCPSRKTGGSLGQIGKGQTVPEFDEQILRLRVGLAELPIESRYGFHVVRLKKKILGKPLEYDMVAEKIKSYLAQKALQLSIQAYIQSLVDKANIIGIQIGFADGNFSSRCLRGSDTGAETLHREESTAVR